MRRCRPRRDGDSAVTHRGRRTWVRAAAALAGAVGLLVGPTVIPAAPQSLLDQLRRGDVRGLAPGKLLVAARNLPDPNFADTVVLLADFDANGAMGLIVNRPSDVPLERLLPGLRHPRGRAATAFFGGPVPADGVLALLRSRGARADSRQIVGDVHLVTTREALDEMLAAGADAQRFRVYVGYAGWGAGQLDKETANGVWHVLDASGDVVFDKDPESLWRRLIRRVGGLSVQGPARAPPGAS
jgi:putative transcriptional regulator